jgi:hypothetical protein
MHKGFFFGFARTHCIHADPLRLLSRPNGGQHGRAESSSSRHSRSSSPHHSEPSEKLKREQSVKANRHQKFIECLSREDVDMGSFFLLMFTNSPPGTI